MADERSAGAVAPVARMDLDEMLERAKGDPKPEPAGECVVCRGQLLPDIKADGHDGWYCERCGLRYHHLPSRPPHRVYPLAKGGKRH